MEFRAGDRIPYFSEAREMGKDTYIFLLYKHILLTEVDKFMFPINFAVFPQHVMGLYGCFLNSCCLNVMFVLYVICQLICMILHQLTV